MKKILKALKACECALEWVEDRTIEQAVADCHRGDWLLWLADKLKIDKRKLSLATGMCANTVRHLMTNKGIIKAVDDAIAYGRGEIGDKEFNAVAADVYAAYAATTAAAYAAAAHAAGYAYSDAARAKNEKQTADICREIIGQEIINKFNELL
jgi:hypothetical protein